MLRPPAKKEAIMFRFRIQSRRDAACAAGTRATAILPLSFVA
jgi:hypothetical protein